MEEVGVHVFRELLYFAALLHPNGKITLDMFLTPDLVLAGPLLLLRSVVRHTSWQHLLKPKATRILSSNTYQ